MAPTIYQGKPKKLRDHHLFLGVALNDLQRTFVSEIQSTVKSNLSQFDASNPITVTTGDLSVELCELGFFEESMLEEIEIWFSEHLKLQRSSELKLNRFGIRALENKIDIGLELMIHDKSAGTHSWNDSVYRMVDEFLRRVGVSIDNDRLMPWIPLISWSSSQDLEASALHLEKIWNDQGRKGRALTWPIKELVLYKRLVSHQETHQFPVKIFPLR